MKGRVAWAVFAVGVLIAAGALAWVSAALLELEHAHAKATARAIADETTRAAMWQFESELSPLVADQASRPYSQYSNPHLPRSLGGLPLPHEGGMPLQASPLRRVEPGFVLLNFQFGPDGKLTSPNVPHPASRDYALEHVMSQTDLDHAEARLKQLEQTVSRDELLSQLPSRTRHESRAQSPEAIFENDRWEPTHPSQQAEYQQRSQATKRTALNSQAGWLQGEFEQLRPTRVREGPMTALWAGETLLLARRVVIGEGEYVQGCVLDWPAIRESLSNLAATLLPGAEFHPASLDPLSMNSPRAYRLASLPIEVLPGEPSVAAGGWSPIRSALYAAWACMAAVALSLAFVLGRTLSLAARREEFVSAVTHELRTPLTTFRMYTELLQSGRVTDETARREYYDTLHAESLRLGHLVENVLAYARLENRDNGERLEALPLSSLLERATERLARRAAQSGMQVQIAPCADVHVRADPVAVEQILFNLVDNACKHGRGPVNIECEASDRRAIISVTDHGAGINSHEAARLFKPFRKSAQQAADSAPGVGLGLALSRRLARAMGGELSLDTTNKEGTRFLLKLPLVEGN